eukprot:jgi/Mesen1/5025/ME000025S04423
MSPSEMERPTAPVYRSRASLNEVNTKKGHVKVNGYSLSSADKVTNFNVKVVSSPEKSGLWDGRADGSLSSSDESPLSEAGWPERVRVTIRVRPPTPAEAKNDVGTPAMEISPDNDRVIIHPYRLGMIEPAEFQFDAVLPPEAGQGDVYNVAARPIVRDVLNGYNGTIMAYGQTGAGKTYTLSSTIPEQLGIIPRASADVFEMASADSEHDYRVTMSYIQIYMEMIQDLLRPPSSNMQIRENEHGVYISGVHEVEVKKVDDCLRLLALGERNRAFAFTKLNAHSSRSHAIAILTVEKRSKKAADHSPGREEKPNRPRYQEANQSAEERRASGGHDNLHSSSTWAKSLRGSDSSAHSPDDRRASRAAEPAPQNPEERRMSNGYLREKVLIGKLFMVDLAGSERLKKSGSEGVRANEAKSVNLSLTVLGKCINARADPSASHVPFRDSKLTRLLQESLGGNAKTSLVINAAPSTDHISESLSSLLFASRAMQVKTKAVVNVEEDYQHLSASLQETLDEHNDRVHSLESEEAGWLVHFRELKGRVSTFTGVNACTLSASHLLHIGNGCQKGARANVPGGKVEAPVVVYSQEEQLSQAKANLKKEHDLVLKLRSEKEKLVKEHEDDIAAREAAWQHRLRKAERAAEQRHREAAEQHEARFGQGHELSDIETLLEALLRLTDTSLQNLARQVDSAAAQRDSMAEAMRKSLAYSEMLEQQLKELQESVDRLEREKVTKAELLSQEERARKREDQAARRIQRAFWSHRFKNLQQQLNEDRQQATQHRQIEREGLEQEMKHLVEEKQELETLALAAGHKLVASSLAHISSAFAALDHKFVTPRAQRR